MNYTDKIRELKDLPALSQQYKNKIVLVGGCFDLFHYGHLFFLQRAKEQGGHLMVLVETDSFIESKKKKRPVHTQRQRAELLASLLPVDSVIMLPVMQDADRDYSHIVHTIRPAVIAMTKGDRQQSRKELMAHEVGAKTHIIEHLSSFSSSQLITYASIFRN